MQKINVVIIEDEVACQQHIKTVLQTHFPDMNFVATIDNVPAAIEKLNISQPDILFLDIEIKMGTGFDILAALPEVTSEVILTTAYNQFAIEAFRYHAVDYLLKPLEDEQVVKTVKRSIARIEQKKSNQQIGELLMHLQKPVPAVQRIGIHTVEGIDFIDTDQILFAEAKGNYTELRLKTGAKITASKKLKEMEEALPAHLFFRVHNSYIVHLGSIRKYYKGRGGYLLLDGEVSIPVSASRKDEFLKKFGEEY